MALPLLPLAVGAATGIGGAAIGGLMGGGKKESTTIHEPYSYYAPTQMYAPSVQYAPQSAYSYVGATYVVDSPAAYVSPRAEAAPYSAPVQSPAPEQVQESFAAGQRPVNWTTIGIVGIVGVAAVMILTAPKKRKR